MAKSTVRCLYDPSLPRDGAGQHGIAIRTCGFKGRAWMSLSCAARLPSRSRAALQNHTAHNQSYKNHRNGIKKERVGFSVKGSKPSLKGVRRRADHGIARVLQSVARKPPDASLRSIARQTDAPTRAAPPLVAPRADRPQVPAQPAVCEEVQRQGTQCGVSGFGRGPAADGELRARHARGFLARFDDELREKPRLARAAAALTRS